MGRIAPEPQSDGTRGLSEDAENKLTCRLFEEWARLVSNQRPLAREARGRQAGRGVDRGHLMRADVPECVWIRARESRWCTMLTWHGTE